MSEVSMSGVEQPEAQEAWSVTPLSLTGTLYPVAIGLVGIGCLILGFVGLFHPWGRDAPYSIYWLMMGWGVCLITACAFVLVFTARWVIYQGHGVFVFKSMVRATIVRKGDVMSVRSPSFLLDRLRMYPWSVRTSSSRFFLSRQIQHSKGLEMALIHWNPGLMLDRYPFT